MADEVVVEVSTETVVTEEVETSTVVEEAGGLGASQFARKNAANDFDAGALDQTVVLPSVTVNGWGVTIDGEDYHRTLLGAGGVLFGGGSADLDVAIVRGGAGAIVVSDGATVAAGSVQTGDLVLEGDATFGGSGGPKVLSGSGSPEGVETAPVGSIYLETAAGRHWTKTQGAGSSGWERDPSRRSVSVGNRAAVIGNSNVLGYPATLGRTYQENSFFSQACWRSQGRLWYVENLGVFGATSATILAGLSGNLDSTIDVAFIMATSNDVASAVPLATTAANVDSIVRYVERLGAIPVLVTDVPRTGYVGEIVEIRRWMLDYARRRRVHLIDAWALTVDPSTGELDAAYDYGDGVHLNVAGAEVVAAAIDAWASQWVYEGWPYLAEFDTSVLATPTDANLIQNGNFLGSLSGSPSLPSGWSQVAGSSWAQNSLSLVAADSGDDDPYPFGGQWLRFTKNASATLTAGVQQTVDPSLWDVGDVLRFSGAVRIPVALTNASVEVGISWTGAGPVLDHHPFYTWAGDGTYRFVVEAEAPAGATGLAVTAKAKSSGSFAGGTVFDVSALTLTNETTSDWSSYA